MSVQYSLYSDLEHYRNSPPAPVLVQEVSFDGKVRLKANSTKYAKIHVLHRVALLILLILPLANKGFLWYALSTERVSPMKS